VQIRPALIVMASAFGACGQPAAAPPPIRFLHTFGPEETELFNATMAERGMTVEPLLAPFARGQQVISEILHAQNCPDLIRIDATWLPGLVANNLLVEVPAALAALDWTPEAAALAQLGGVWWSLPQAVDGLIVIHDLAIPAPASPSLPDLLAAARAARARTGPYPLGVRVDGYWFVPWLRDEGGELAAPGGIAGDGAVRAMTRLATLAGSRGRLPDHRAVAVRRAPRAPADRGQPARPCPARRPAARRAALREAPRRRLAARRRADLAAGPGPVRRRVRERTDPARRARRRARPVARGRGRPARRRDAAARARDPAPVRRSPARPLGGGRR
jgi:hypothetical protein